MTVDVWGWVYWVSRFIFHLSLGGQLALIIYVYYKKYRKDKDSLKVILSAIIAVTFIGMMERYNDYPIHRATFEVTKVGVVLRVGKDFRLTTSDGLIVTHSRGFPFSVKNGYFYMNIPKPEVGTCVDLQFVGTEYPLVRQTSGWVAYVDEVSIAPSSCAKLATKKEFLSALDLYNERALLWEKNLADARSRLTEDELEDYLRSTYEGK